MSLIVIVLYISNEIFVLQIIAIPPDLASPPIYFTINTIRYA
jgi:hypothetical protein